MTTINTPLTVAQLIEKLQKFNPNAIVEVPTGRTHTYETYTTYVPLTEEGIGALDGFFTENGKPVVLLGELQE